jgi:hypothetical protein
LIVGEDRNHRFPGSNSDVDGQQGAD